MAAAAIAEAAMQQELPADAISVTCTAPVNIAVIKYWGKRDIQRILPTNSSLSATLDQDCMRSQTTITASKTFESHSMTLNGKPVKIESSPRLLAVMEALLKRAEDLKDAQGNVKVAKDEWKDYKLQVTSYNNFPTAAGLASSASGLACFTKCLASVYQVQGELTEIARQGSGSACRSLEGEFVAWEAGEKEDGSDSLAFKVENTPEFWAEELRMLILVASAKEKKVSSTDGMQDTVNTSRLFKERIKLVPGFMAEMKGFIQAGDFSGFAELTMRDSNMFHSTCLDTYPPIFYMNDSSKHVVELVHAYNSFWQRKTGNKALVASYTFDAGPNAVVFTTKTHMSTLLKAFKHYFAPVDGSDAENFPYDPLGLAAAANEEEKESEAPLLGEEDFAALLEELGERDEDDKISQIILTKMGKEGAKAVLTRFGWD